MRIALLSFHFAEYSLLLARALAQRHPVLLFLDTDNAMAELGKIPGDEDTLRVRCLRRHTFRSAGCYGNMATIVGELHGFGPEVIHCQEVLRDYLTPLLPFFRRWPLVLTIHDPIPHVGSDSRLLPRSQLHRWLLRRAADAVIVHGERICHETEKLLHRLRGKVYVVPHGVIGGESGDVESDWEEGTILFFGRVNRYKGLDILLQAVDKLRERGRTVRLVVAGSGPELNRWRSVLLRDPHATLLEGFIPPERLPELFGKANVVVLPYTDGTQSGVAALALTFGRPMVASDVGSLGEMVRHGINGLLVPPGESGPLADALERLLSDRAMADEFAAASRTLGKTEFSWAHIAGLTTAVYEAAGQ